MGIFTISNQVVHNSCQSTVASLFVCGNFLQHHCFRLISTLQIESCFAKVTSQKVYTLSPIHPLSYIPDNVDESSEQKNTRRLQKVPGSATGPRKLTQTLPVHVTAFVQPRSCLNNILLHFQTFFAPHNKNTLCEDKVILDWCFEKNSGQKWMIPKQ